MTELPGNPLDSHSLPAIISPSTDLDSTMKHDKWSDLESLERLDRALKRAAERQLTMLRAGFRVVKRSREKPSETPQALPSEPSGKP